ncbi:28777_t:CDS:2 [Gigaspora margarita]|uniref:28777_t:CDS:1 n=1 Tax=Gigaspora margarita TaxID=4874 RepID=A0ABN7UWE2_GIGMA|nr:28777_t:CDS:2 [Gigaspora margarita]
MAFLTKPVQLKLYVSSSSTASPKSQHKSTKLPTTTKAAAPSNDERPGERNAEIMPN